LNKAAIVGLSEQPTATSVETMFIENENTGGKRVHAPPPRGRAADPNILHDSEKFGKISYSFLAARLGAWPIMQDG
jgi:hypothetical protein